MNETSKMAVAAVAAGLALAGAAAELRLTFDGDGQPAPTRCENVEMVKGLSGKAVHIGKDSTLEYSTGLPGFLTATSGTFMAWFRRDKTLSGGSRYRDCARNDNGNIQWIFASGTGMRTLFASSSSSSFVEAGLFLMGQMGPSGVSNYWNKRIQGGEWHFAAVTYDAQSGASLWYADGGIVKSNAFCGAGVPFAKTFTLGCGRGRLGLEGAIDEVCFMPVALDEASLRGEYLKWQPIRYELLDWSVGEGETKKFRFRARNESDRKVEKDIRFSIAFEDNMDNRGQHKVVSSCQSCLLSLAPNELKDFSVEVKGGKPGLFKLWLNEGEPDARQFECMCLGREGLEDNMDNGGQHKVVSSCQSCLTNIPKKTLVGEYDCTKPYPDDRVALCASEIVTNGALAYLESRDYRTAVPLAAYRFKIRTKGRPHIVELDYPDDRHRTFLFGVYPEKWTRLHTKTIDCAGVMTGLDVPLSMRMQTKRLVFWPDSDTVSVVVQNFKNNALAPVSVGCIGDSPAACAAVRLYEMDGLPPGPVQGSSPKKRSIATWDEDPNIDSNLAFAQCFNFYNCDLEFWRVKWQRTIDYMRWNSMDSWVIKVTQYNGDETCMDATIPEAATPWDVFCGDCGRCRGWAELGADMLNRAGMGFWLHINHRCSDWFRLLGGGESGGNGGLFGCKDGSFWRLSANFLDPAVRKAYLRLVAAYRDKFSSYPGFKGIAMNEALPIHFGSLDYGYDDTTIGCFERDTGIKVPSKDMKERHAWLTEDKERLGRWTKWRCEKTEQFAGELAATLRANGGDAEIQMWIFLPHCFTYKWQLVKWENWDAEKMFLDAGVDLARIAKTPGVRPVPCFHSDFCQARNDGRIDRLTSDADYCPCSPSWVGLMRSCGVEAFNSFRPNLELYPSLGTLGAAANAWNTEFWLPTHNLLPYLKDFQCYATPHPAPPYTLDSVASLVADADMQDYLTGWWGIMESGEHDEWRRFYGQFREIPRGRYALAKGPDDPVAVRSGAEGHYLVNREPYPVKVEYIVDGKHEKLILRRHEIRFVESRGANGNVEVVKLTIPTEEKAKHLANLEKLEAGAKSAPNDTALVRAAKEAREAFDSGRIHQFRALFHLGAVRKFMHPEICAK